MNNLLSKLGLSFPVLALATTMVLSGCKSTTVPAQKPQANAPPAAPTVPIGPITMPAGVDFTRASLVAENRRTKIYTTLRWIGDRRTGKLLLPPEITQAMGLTAGQLERRFLDTVSRSRRFEIYDASGTLTEDATDFLVDGQFTGVSQDVQNLEGGVRVAVTRVRLSLQLKERFSGKLLFPAAVEVVGQTGRSTGDRVVLGPLDKPSDPEVQKRLARDYERALQRAFDDAAARLEQVLKPMAKVLAIDGEQVGLVGGSTHGLQRGDELVVFRATTTKVGDSEVFATTRPIAVIRCDGVGTETSQCTTIRRAGTGEQVRAGDFAILTDQSAKGLRDL